MPSCSSDHLDNSSDRRLVSMAGAGPCLSQMLVMSARWIVLTPIELLACYQ